VQGLDLLALALELGQAAVYDIDQDVAAGFKLDIPISVPAGYYGLLVHAIRPDPGQVVPGAFNLTIAHKGVVKQAFRLTDEKIRDGLRLFSWVTSGSEITLTLENLDTVSRKFFASRHQVNFMFREEYDRFRSILEGLGTAFGDRIIYGGVRVITVAPGAVVPVPVAPVVAVQAPWGVIRPESDYLGG